LQSIEVIKKYTSKKIDENLKVVSEDIKYIARGVALKYFPLVVARASGVKVWDLDGNEYIDFLSSAAVFNVGHSNIEVVKAIKDQLEKFIHYGILYLYHKPAVELAKLLVEITPGTFEKKVIFGLSGSDANDSAIKASRVYTGRPNIASFTYSYHGTTYGAISVSGVINPKIRAKVYPLPNVHFLPYPDTYRCPFDMEPKECGEYYLGLIEEYFQRVVDGESFAALIIEPIQGDAGILIPPRNFMEGLYKLTRKYGIVFIDEEVQTGLCRTGRMFAIEHFGIEPDLIVVGKAIGGGMPISAVIGRREIVDAAEPPTFLLTFSGHSLSAVAAIATIKYAIRERLAERARKLGEYALKRFNEMKDKYEIIGDVRGLGLLIGIEIVKNKKTKEPDRNTTLKIIWRCWEKGLLMMSFGKYGNVLRIAPPLTIELEELDKGINIIEDSIRDVLTGKVSNDVIKILRPW